MFTPFAFVKSAVAAAPPGYTGILDTYTGSYFGYSVRRLSGAYNGYCMQVKRSSDSSVLDVGFDSNGNLDTGSITTFVGGGDGWVNIWYDQSGNGINITPDSTTGNGFFIVSSGTLRTLNGKAAPYTPRGNEYNLGNNSISITSNNIQWTNVSGVDDDTQTYNVYGRVLSMKNTSNSLDYDNCNSIINFYSRLAPFSSNMIVYQNNGYTTTGRPYTLDTQNLNFNYKDGNTVGGNTNGGSNNSSTTGCGTTNLNINQMRLGNDYQTPSDSNLTGWIQEVILWPTYTSGNQSGIVTNTNNYFGTF
jgi:hypothetical protein